MGFQLSLTIEAGVKKGGAFTGSIGGGTFHTGLLGNGFGGFASAGAFAHGTNSGLDRFYPDVSDNRWVAGSFAGIGLGPWFSNAQRITDLTGPFHQLSINFGNLIGLGISIAWDDSGTIFVSGSGKGGYGASISYYPTTTITTPGR